MNTLSIDLVDALTHIRKRAVALADGGWPELGALIHSILPNPLNPIVLLPIATGNAVGGKTEELIPAAAAVVLIDLSLRIVDDCADQDNPHALYHSVGVGQAMNHAMALNTIAARELFHAPLSADRSGGLLDDYFHSFLQVCEGQDRDMRKVATSLAEYEGIVKLKGVAAYQFAAVAGARLAAADANAIALCSQCGSHLGWMTQLLDDIEALWFPVAACDPEVERLTYPVLLGMTIDHPNSRVLEGLYQSNEYNRTHICLLLDEMDVRTKLMSSALDHRDKAIEMLGGAFNPEGSGILKVWLDWLLRDGVRLLRTVNE